LFQALPARDDVTVVTLVDNPAPEPARDAVALFTVERYFRHRTACSVRRPVELLEGVVVAMAPRNTPRVRRGERIGLVAFPDTRVAFDELLPVVRR
jgi:hypothetical protein